MAPGDACNAQEAARRVIADRRQVQSDYPPCGGMVCPAFAPRRVPGPDARNREALRAAASRGLTDAASELSPGCDLFPCSHQLDRYGKNTLRWYEDEGKLDVLSVLLMADGWANPPCLRSATALNVAAGAGHEQEVQLLLASGAGAVDRGGEAGRNRRTTALHHAAVRGHVGVVSLLLSAGFDREQQDENGSTPLDLALQTHSDPAITQRLLPRDRGARLVQRHCDLGNVAIVQSLARGGAYLDLHDEVGDTPLHRAAHFGDVGIAETLIAAGAKVNARNLRGGAPLHIAACSGCVAIVAALLEDGADIESRMLNGRSPLHMAVLNNKIEVVETLLRAGAHVEHRDHERGQTPLAEASEYRLAPIVRALVTAGADIESRSSLGLTPLHWACRFGCPDTVEALLSAGADPDSVDGAAAKVPSLTTALDKDASRAGRPVAADVVYLGDPMQCFESTPLPTIKKLVEVHRREHVSEVRRIRASLERARTQMPWRRRGWLMILARRYAIGQLSLAGGTCTRKVQGRLATADSATKKQRVCRQTIPALTGPGSCCRAGKDGTSAIPPRDVTPDNSSKSRCCRPDPGLVADADGMAGLIRWNRRASRGRFPRDYDRTHGFAGLGKGGTCMRGDVRQVICGADLVGAVGRLLETGTIEPGVFRHVVLYI